MRRVADEKADICLRSKQTANSDLPTGFDVRLHGCSGLDLAALLLIADSAAILAVVGATDQVVFVPVDDNALSASMW